MAMSDYLCCANCGNKAIYDAELPYESSVRYGRLADIAALCKDCYANGHRLVVLHYGEDYTEKKPNRSSDYVAALVYNLEHEEG